MIRNLTLFFLLCFLSSGCTKNKFNAEESIKKVLAQDKCGVNYKLLSTSDGLLNGLEGETHALNFTYQCQGNGNLLLNRVIVVNANKQVVASYSFEPSNISSVKSIKISNGVIKVNALIFSDEDPRCCPSLDKNLILSLNGKNLTLTDPSDKNASLSFTKEKQPSGRGLVNDMLHEMSQERQKQLDEERKDSSQKVSNSADLYYAEAEKIKNPARAFCYYIIASKRGNSKGQDKANEILKNVPLSKIEDKNYYECVFGKYFSGDTSDSAADARINGGGRYLHYPLTIDAVPYKLLTLDEYLHFDSTKGLKSKKLSASDEQEKFETTNEYSNFTSDVKVINWIGRIKNSDGVDVVAGIQHGRQIAPDSDIQVLTNHHYVTLLMPHNIKTIVARSNDIVRFSGSIDLFERGFPNVKIDSIEVIGHDDTEDNFIKNGYK